MSAATVLGLDASSTSIGWCLLRGRQVLASGQALLQGTIAQRCLVAQKLIYNLAERHAPDAVAIESPVAKFASALIPQARVSGAILAVVASRGLLWQEVPPTAAKKALSGSGSSGKDIMQKFAQSYGVEGEHASDALGVALAIVDAVIVADEVPV